jgi:hypothetical protein
MDPNPMFASPDSHGNNLLGDRLFFLFFGSSSSARAGCHINPPAPSSSANHVRLWINISDSF